ncbi:MAG: hypothetical protein DCF21_11270 [Leptolyngbya sp.]|nr:MAG: hypothetical protein DCF21_11270 [Leptolyngbya sp.]
MSTAETIYELVKTLPEEKASLVLVFTQFVQQQVGQQQSKEACLSSVPSGTLTSLRGIANPAGKAPTDSAVVDDYTDYLIEKYLKKYQ